MSEEFVATPVGTACITWYPARGSVRAVALLGHGSATGIESADLQALAVLALAYPLLGPGSSQE